jgi:hypothetical protein
MSLQGKQTRIEAAAAVLVAGIKNSPKKKNCSYSKEL